MIETIKDTALPTDNTGRISRTIMLGRTVTLLGALQISLPLVGVHIPPAWQWAYGLVMCIIGVAVEVLRRETKTGME